MKNYLGSLPQNLSMLKNSFPTSTLLICKNLALFPNYNYFLNFPYPSNPYIFQSLHFPNFTFLFLILLLFQEKTIFIYKQKILFYKHSTPPLHPSPLFPLIRQLLCFLQHFLYLHVPFFILCSPQPHGYVPPILPNLPL